ncbi:hypothetical protein RQP46_009189 [Phenoliferia psychrophenolica]
MAQAPASFASFTLSPSLVLPTGVSRSQASPSPSPRTSLAAPGEGELEGAQSSWTRRANIREREREERLSGTVRLGDGKGDAAFEMLVVGCGGGPLETNLSSYLLKPYSHKWAAGCTALEGGSGIGALANLIEAFPRSFRGFDLHIGVDDEDEPSGGEHKANGDAWNQRGYVGPGREGGGRGAGRVWGFVRCFAVTHAHLDHIAGLIVSSGASLFPRPLYGLTRTINNIDRMLDGGVWPKLAGYEDDGVLAGRAYLYRDIPAPTTQAMPLSDGLSFQAFPLSHGLDPSAFHCRTKPLQDPPAPPECYDSTAFFVKEEVTGEGYEMLFFGDVEPDSISKRPLNREVWKCAAPKIAAQKLTAIFLECSYPTSQPSEKLWGHLSPPYMFEELKVLAELVVEARVAAGSTPAEARILPLAGVNVIIIHIKDDILPLPIPLSITTTAPSPVPSEALEAFPAGLGSPQLPLSPNFNSTSPSIGGLSLSSIASSRFENENSLLSMGPPVPSIPIRRASGGNLPGGGWGFTRRASLATATPLDGRRMSLPGFLGATGIGLDKLVSPAARRANGSGSAASGSLETTEELSEGSTNPSPTVPSSMAFVDGFHNAGEAGPGAEEETEEETVHERIERELNDIEEVERTGVRFLRAEQGMRIAF